MIRNVILHLQDGPPMKADIEALPAAGDAGLLCTNLRTLEGDKPTSTEFLDSVFLVPYSVLRFVEIPRESIANATSRAPATGHAAQVPAGVPGAVPGATPPGAAATSVAALDDDEPLEERELDEDLLRRIREA